MFAPDAFDMDEMAESMEDVRGMAASRRGSARVSARDDELLEEVGEEGLAELAVWVLVFAGLRSETLFGMGWGAKADCSTAGDGVDRS